MRQWQHNLTRVHFFGGRSVSHKGQLYTGEHEAIIDRELWQRVQDKMAKKKSGREKRQSLKRLFLLKGKLRTYEGFAMSPSTAGYRKKQNDKSSRDKTPTRYYVSQKGIKHGYQTCAIKTLNADKIETLVITLIQYFFFQTIPEVFRLLNLSIHQNKKIPWLIKFIEQVSMGPEWLVIKLDRQQVNAFRDCPEHQELLIRYQTEETAFDHCVVYEPVFSKDGDSYQIKLPIRIQRLKSNQVLVSPEGKELLVPERSRPRPEMVQAIGRAFLWRKMLEDNPTLSIQALAHQCGYKSRAYIRQHLNLVGLAPDILEMALTGTLPIYVSLNKLCEAAKHLCWDRQRAMLNILPN